MSETAPRGLSMREIEVLQLIADGLVTKEIARVLKISPKTIDLHRARIKSALEAKTAFHVVALGLRKGLIK